MSHPLSERIREFAEMEPKDSSPLYYALSCAIADDISLLEVAAYARPGQPVPNLFFAAVQYLLATNREHSLRAFYSTFTEMPANPAEAFPSFKDFVCERRDEIVALLESRLVQTNEVGRCAYLLPAILFAASHFQRGPLALIEIGTSAGLNLLWDRYRYSYGGSASYGDQSSDVRITSAFRGITPSILSSPMPEISHRIGLDLNIVDTADADQADWLRALIWPEHRERRRLLEAALRKRKEVELDLRFGNGFERVFDIESEIPKESLLCIYHTHVANQISKDACLAFLNAMEKLGKKRDVIHIFNNIKPGLHLTAYRNGHVIDMPLVKTDGHARWIAWLPKN